MGIVGGDRRMGRGKSWKSNIYEYEYARLWTSVVDRSASSRLATLLTHYKDLRRLRRGRACQLDSVGRC